MLLEMSKSPSALPSSMPTFVSWYGVAFAGSLIVSDPAAAPAVQSPPGPVLLSLAALIASRSEQPLLTVGVRSSAVVVTVMLAAEAAPGTARTTTDAAMARRRRGGTGPRSKTARAVSTRDGLVQPVLETRR